MNHMLAPEAEADLDGIFSYTWETYGAAQAERYYRELRATIELLADAPMLARERT